MTAEVPPWVYDVVIELQRWSDNHPRLFADTLDQEAGQFRMTKVDDCGCKPLDLVPDDVKAEARALARYLNQRTEDQAEIERLRTEVAEAAAQRTTAEEVIQEHSARLAKALGLDRPQHYESMAEMVEELVRPGTGRSRTVSYVDEPPSRFPVPCWTAADAALAVFAKWLREHAAGARFIAENASEDEDLSTVALWGGARAALSALADEIDPRAPEGQQG